MPLLGICLGMQWLFEGSAEAPDGIEVLALIQGRLHAHRGRAAAEGSARRLEHADPPRDSALLSGVSDGAHVYFTHTFRRTGDRGMRGDRHSWPALRRRGRTRSHLGRAVPSRKILRDRASGSAELRPDGERPMLARRIIACLDVRNGCVVKGVNFQDLRNAGIPAALAQRYNAEGIDEMVILDVTATIEGATGPRNDHP